jgi:hypothetical protein
VSFCKCCLHPHYTHIRHHVVLRAGVYLGSFPLLKFSGVFTWAEERCRLDFTFDKVAVLGITLPYNQGESKVQPG